MNKLQNYNQKILAIIGTLAIGILTLVLISVGYFVITEIFSDLWRNDYQSNALVVDKTPKEEALREQEITFQMPRLIDTLNAVYLIPVSQVNLEKPEVIEREIFGYSSTKRIKEYVYSYSGVFNNIILYFQRENKKKTVFNQKVNINQFENYVIKGQHFLLLRGTTKDSNKDGKLDAYDLQSFFIYDIGQNQLNEVALPNMSLTDYYIFHESDEVLLRFGLDKNQDGSFDSNKEPTILKKYLIAENQTTDLIDEAMKDTLQKLIE